MANTTLITNRSLQIKGLDADWTVPGDLTGFLASGLKVKSIKFQPSATGDILVIKASKGSHTTAATVIAATTTAPEIMHVKVTADTDQRIEYFNEGQWMWPFIDISDCTFSTAANARIEFELA